MTSMVEKVARAIYEEMDLSDSLALPEAERYARAAIQAMREMTPDMLEAAEAKDQEFEYAWAELHWEAAIDAALKEE